jgi:F-type H+-transporting ATPase subunit epsilon
MADSDVFNAQVVTPERVLVNGPASQVILRTADGDITFLAGHTPLVGTVEPGVVRVVGEDGEEQRIAVHGGFVQVEQHVDDDADTDTDSGRPSSSSSSGTRVTVLAGIAELAEEIDTERARLSREAAEAKVSELASAGRTAGTGSGSGEDDEDDAEVVEAEAALRRAEVRLEAAGVTTSAGS